MTRRTLGIIGFTVALSIALWVLLFFGALWVIRAVR